MQRNLKKKHIAYRCPECAVATVGLVLGLGDEGGLLRIKCECGGSALDIAGGGEDKIKISAPCVYCRDSHSYTLAGSVLGREALTSLSCPFSGMDIVFLGGMEDISPALDKSANELSVIMASLDAEDVRDIQPQDMDEDECPPDPAIFDTINFVVRDLEAEGRISCPCASGEYGLRFTDDGMQVYCERCGASFNFHARSAAVAEEYLTLDEIKLG